MGEIKLAYRIWLDKGGKAFGEGPLRLLKLVETKGSLNKAAIEMKMSYRKAWTVVSSIEERLGFPLLERHIGGSEGGGSTLTPQGADFIKKYEAFRADAKKDLEAVYRKYSSHFTLIR